MPARETAPLATSCFSRASLRWSMFKDTRALPARALAAAALEAADCTAFFREVSSSMKSTLPLDTTAPSRTLTCSMRPGNSADSLTIVCGTACPAPDSSTELPPTPLRIETVVVSTSILPESPKNWWYARPRAPTRTPPPMVIAMAL